MNKIFIRILCVSVFALLLVSCKGARTEKSAEFISPADWEDIVGEYINAHGGGILTYEGKYYWFEENRPLNGFVPEMGVNC